MRKPPIVLLTDFGLADGYPGVMKGVIHSFCPNAPIIDLSHGVPAHHLRAAAFLLSKNCRYFPQGSIFVVVVDPGVGSDRKILYLEWKDWRFLAPDNGVLSPLLLEPEFAHELREVTQSDLFLVKRGNTFDGRDRFAPVAAQLARGFHPCDLGPELSGPVIIKDLLTKARFRGNSITGQVAYVDSFGNLITTIEESDVARLKSSSGVGVRIVGQRIPLLDSYSEVSTGEPLAVIGGFGTVEIAVNQGNAHKMLRVPVGQTVVVEPLDA